MSNHLFAQWTAKSCQAGDQRPSGRVWDGEKWLSGHHPASGAGRPAPTRNFGAYGAPGAQRLQLQQPGSSAEGGGVGWRGRNLETAGCASAENNLTCRWTSKRLEDLCSVIKIKVHFSYIILLYSLLMSSVIIEDINSSMLDLKVVYSLTSCSTVPPCGVIAPGRLSARRNSASDLADPFVVFTHDIMTPV